MGSFLLRQVLANLRSKANTLEITVPKSRKMGLSYTCANYPCRNYPLTSATLNSLEPLENNHSQSSLFLIHSGSREPLRSLASLQNGPFLRDAAYLLTIGSFLLTAELFITYSCVWEALLLALEALLLTVDFLLTIEVLCLQWDYQQRNSAVSKETPTASKQASAILYTPLFQKPFSEAEL